jgi:hypothetical protein
MIDGPLLIDSHDQTPPFIYVGGAPVRTGDWPGADVQVSLSGRTDAYTSGWDAIATSEVAGWGTVLGTLPDTSPSVIDEATDLVVEMAAGTTFVSVTEAALLEDQSVNLMLIGKPGRWEYIQARDAFLESGGTWRLSGLVRGVRGTEHNIGNHEPDDYVILVSNAITLHDMGASQIGQTGFFRAITFGLGSTSQDPTEVTFAAEAHRPLSPCNLEVVRDPATGSFSISWIRRTRIGGATLNGQDVPLGQSSEKYVVRIIDGSNNTIRTEYPLTNSFEYDTYMQIEDAGSELASISVEVAQIDPTLNLEGRVATASS